MQLVIQWMVQKIVSLEDFALNLKFFDRNRIPYIIFYIKNYISLLTSFLLFLFTLQKYYITAKAIHRTSSPEERLVVKASRSQFPFGFQLVETHELARSFVVVFNRRWRWLDLKNHLHTHTASATSYSLYTYVYLYLHYQLYIYTYTNISLFLSV